MFQFKKTSFFKLIFLFTFISVSNSPTNGQKITQYHRRNQMDAHSVQDITFGYTISNGDTIIQGEYQSLLFSYYADSISNVRKLRLNYKNGVPNGEFYLEKATFTTKNNFPSYRSFRVQQAIKGNSLFATGQYVNGIRTGTWTQYDVLIDDRKMDTLASIHATFSKNGKWHGLFSIKDTNFYINGQINEGVPNGKWEGEWNQKTVKLHFNEGVITQFSIGAQFIDFSTSSEEKYQEENLHEVFPAFVAVFPTENTAFNSEAQQVASKIAAAIRGFVPNKNLTEAKNKKFTFDAVRIRMPIQPITQEDKNKLQAIKEKYTFLNAALKNVISEPNLLLSCNENLEIAKSMSIFRLVSQRLQAFLPVIEIANSPFSNFVNWENVVQLSIRNANKIQKDEYTCLNESHSQTLASFPYNKSLTAIENLLQQLDTLSPLYEKNKSLVEKQLIEVQHSEDLIKIRQDFVTLQRGELENDIEHITIPYYQKEYQEGFLHFKNLLVQRFKEASDNSNKDQMESVYKQAVNLVLLLQQTSEWVRLHDVITERNKYMYLDPNTFEERKEILYVQLYKTYERKLMPFVISQLSCNFNHFNEFKASFDNIMLVQQKMLEILDQDPKKMNRKLKQRDSIDKVIEKMGLILN